MIEIFCAYLRLPFTYPQEQLAPADTNTSTDTRPRSQTNQIDTKPQRNGSLEEREVRSTALTLALDLLPTRGEAAQNAYGLPLLRLDGATIDHLIAPGRAANIQARKTHVIGPVNFEEGRLGENIDFTVAHFDGEVKSNGTRFDADACFNHARFAREVSFVNSIIKGDLEFIEARPAAYVSFEHTKVSRSARFDRTVFSDALNLNHCRVGQLALNDVRIKSSFRCRNARIKWDLMTQKTQFGSTVDFSETFFGKLAVLDGAVEEAGLLDYLDGATCARPEHVQLPLRFSTEKIKDELFNIVSHSR